MQLLVATDGKYLACPRNVGFRRRSWKEGRLADMRCAPVGAAIQGMKFCIQGMTLQEHGKHTSMGLVGYRVS